jgi:hypothetical protein
MLVRNLSLVMVALAVACVSPASAAEKADEKTVQLYMERFPDVMNASLLQKDCPGLAKAEQTELAWYVQELIAYADPKPELAGGVQAVYQAGLEYDKVHTDAGANFCKDLGPGILEKGLAGAKEMAAHIGIGAYDAAEIDMPELEEGLRKAAKALGAFEKCREVKRDTQAGVAGRFGNFMFFQTVVGEIKVDYDLLKTFAFANGAKPELSKQLDDLGAEGHRHGPEECSLREYMEVETHVAKLVRRYGLTPAAAPAMTPQIVKPQFVKPQ